MLAAVGMSAIRWTAAAVVGLVAVLVSSVAAAAPIAVVDYVETPLSGGRFQYEFTVSNEADPITEAGVDLYDVFLLFPTDVELTELGLPTDWESIAPPTLPFTTPFFQFFSLASSADIRPGEQLSGFRLVLNLQIGAVPFTATFVNPPDPSAPFTIDGVTTPITATAVPEPASLLLVASGGAALFRRRRRQ